MYSVVLSALVSLSPVTPDCHGCRQGQAGCAGCGSSAGYAMPVTIMPSAGCGCGTCGCNTCGASPYGMPDFGGMPMPGSMPMGGMAMPGMGAMPMSPPTGGMPMPPSGGTILPPAEFGGTMQPPTPALGEARTSANQAMFVVTLPADARLIADGNVIPGSGTVRVFVTPALDPAREYFYDLAIEVDRGGKVLRDQQTVKFQAGKTANVTFAEPKAETSPPPPAGKTARIRVRMPNGAALYVEGRPWSGAVIQTPPLDPTQTHYYQLKAEVVRNGRLAVVTREVAFRAGQDVIVDLTAVSLAQIAKASR